jgi:hypothetical protein
VHRGLRDSGAAAEQLHRGVASDEVSRPGRPFPSRHGLNRHKPVVEIRKRSHDGPKLAIQNLSNVEHNSMAAMLEGFSARANRILDNADDEARARCSPFIGSQHVLLALLRESDAQAVRDLSQYGLNYAVLAAEIRPVCPDEPVATSAQLPFTRESKHVLASALKYANLGHSHRVGIEHMLLALNSPQSASGEVLRLHGVPGARMARGRLKAALASRPGGRPSRKASRAQPNRSGYKRNPVVRALSSDASTRSLVWSAYAGGGLFLVSAAIETLALVVDVRAFQAIATPELYAWVILSAVCAAALIAFLRLGHRGNRAPRYFLLTLLVGTAGGVLSLPSAWRVITKANDPAPALLAHAIANYSGRSLTNLNLTGADLQGANFSRAVLHNVSLTNANLAEADMRGARFINVNLSGANLCGADVRGANLSGAVALSQVANWSYTFYNSKTSLPAGDAFIAIAGPIADTGRGLLYMCTPGNAQRIAP